MAVALFYYQYKQDGNQVDQEQRNLRDTRGSLTGIEHSDISVQSQGGKERDFAELLQSNVTQESL